MDEKKVKYLFRITNDCHDLITQIYEDICDEDDKSIEKIDAVIIILKDLKNELIKKDE